MAENDRGFRIAVAGLAATATLGIVAATTTWLNARDDRRSQEALAYQDRVYNRRADAYVAALQLILVHEPETWPFTNQLDGRCCVKWNSPPRFKILSQTINGDVSAQISAFGSAPAIKAYTAMLNALADIQFHWLNAPSTIEINGSFTTRRDAEDDVLETLRQALARYEAARRRFFGLVNREIG